MWESLQALLERPPLAQIRRNHGLEHATIHVLSWRFPGRFFAGYSDAHGFFLWGDVPQEAVEGAVQEALERLRRGERHLAVHPGCGTNYLTMATVGGLAAMLTVAHAPRRLSWWDRFNLVVMGLMAALLLAQPLGRWLQWHITTSSDVHGLEVLGVRRLSRPGRPLYRVFTRYQPQTPA